MKHGWTTQKLGNLFEFKYGKGLIAEHRHVDGSVKVYGSNGIIGRHDHSLSKGPTVVVGRKGSVGQVHFNSSACWPIDTTYYVDEFPDGFPPKYWAFYLESLRLGTHEKSSAIPGVSRKDIYGIEVPVPPLPEQHLIVAKLEKLLAKVEACQERLDKIPALLKRFRQSVLAAACSGRLTADWREKHPDVEPASIFLKRIVNAYKGKTASSPYSYSMDNDIPESWILCNLGTLAELITKGSSPNWQGINYVDKGILFVTSENVGSGNLILEKKKFVEEKFNQIQKRSILKRGDILTNIVGASIGRTAVFDLDEKANINQAVSLIRLKNKISSNYILTVLNSPAIVDFMNSTKVDVARANLSLKDVASFPIPLPPNTEQHEIVHRVEALFKVADQIEERYQKARAYVDKLTQSILAKAFLSDLVPQDPNDEPASALLERIRQERKTR